MSAPTNRKEVTDRIKSDVQSQLPESNPYLKNSFLQAIIFGFGGRIFDVYKYVERLIPQFFFDTAVGNFLKRMASWFGITTLSATQASGNVVLTGTDTTIVPASTIVQDSNGNQYETQSSGTITDTTLSVTSLVQSSGIATATTSSDHNFGAGMSVTISGANETDYNGTFTIISIPTSTTFTYSVPVSTATPATGTITVNAVYVNIEVQSSETGEDLNKDSGEQLTLTATIAGVNDTCYVDYNGITGGSDQETDEALRDRFLFRVQNPVSLFNASAIETQAREIQGVTRVWVQNVDTTQRTFNITTLVSANQVAVGTVTSHGMLDGDKINVTGANEAAYNVTAAPVIIIDTNTFAYAISGTPATPATGVIDGETSVITEGKVKVYFTRDNDTNIIPSSGEVTEVKNKILEIKPAHVADSSVVVSAPTAVPTSFTFSSISPDTTEMREAITANLEAFFLDLTEIGEDVNKIDYDSVIINTVDPQTNNKLQSFTLSSPTTDISIDAGELGTIGSVNFV